jgi:hypothetical protein
MTSVTQIIAPWVKWDHIPEERLAMAAERGTDIHDACHAIALGIGWFPITNEGRAVAGYVDSFRLWFESVVYDVLFTERELKDDNFGFIGHPDLLVVNKDREILLIDLKSPVTRSKSWRLQLAAYAHLCEIAGHRPDKIGSLRLHPKGNPPKMDWYQDSRLQDFNIFSCCLTAHRYLNEKE